MTKDAAPIVRLTAQLNLTAELRGLGATQPALTLETAA